jgi:hypothetical protein
MAASGYTPISLYYSATASAAPTAGNLVAGELALNTADGKLFYKDNANVVQVIATKAGANGTVTSVGGTGTVNGISLSGTVTSSGNLTLGGTLSGVSLTTQVTGTLPIANGGTGATTNTAARTNLGASTLGANIFTITNPSAITFPRFNADNTVSALSAADFRTAIGAGTGGGSVTSVSGTGTASGLTLSGTVTSSGSLTLSGTVNSLAAGTYAISISGSAATLTTGRTISTTGDVSYTSGSFNGSANVTGTATLATVNSNVGTFGSSSAIPVVTVNGKGLVTAVSTATVAGGQYFGTAAVKAIAYNAQTIAENVTVTATNNGLSAGPITINSGFTVTVETGARWIIV